MYVVYIIQGTGKGVFIYMIFIIHVLAALIISNPPQRQRHASNRWLSLG